MERLHYLGAVESNLGKALQYVAEDEENGEWLALMDWGYGALKNSERDRWIGWSKELRDERLKHVVTNTRFLILPSEVKRKNLASQVLSKVVKRLSDDWARYHGHHVLVAETFVDMKRFSGTCYRAANWIEVGKTQGFARSNKRYFEHGEKKLVFVYPLYKRSCEILSSTGFPNRLIMTRKEQHSEIDLNKLPLIGEGGLLDALSKVEDGRFRRGRRYSLRSILGLTVCAILTGIDSFRGIAEFAHALPHEVRLKFGLRKGKAPDEETIRLTLNKVDPLNFDAVVREWLHAQVPSLRGRAIALDGKSMRAARTDQGSPPHILSVLLHHDGVALKTVAVADKTNEIPAAQSLLRSMPIKGAVVTLDAMHTQRETAQLIVTEKKADYLMTVKENQQGLLEKIQRLPEEAFSPSAPNNRQSPRKNRNSLNSSGADRQTSLFPLCQTGSTGRTH